MAYHLSNLKIICAHECGIFFRIDFAVEKYYRDTLVISPVNCRRKKVNLIRRDYQKVDSAIYQAVYLALLELTVIICGSEDKIDSGIEVGRHYEFLLQFLTPGIL